MASLFAVRKEYMNQKLGNLLVYYAYPDLVAHGIKYLFGTSTNPISVKLALNFGGKVLK
jgi:hypothetical protein